jgi:hypothetical protein
MFPRPTIKNLCMVSNKNTKKGLRFSEGLFDKVIVK